jgi:capsular exopolysaccharide synthesis family protein
LDQYEQARLKELMRTNLISIVDPAIVPVAPSKPNKLMNIGLALIFGLLGGIALAFLFENLFGTRLYTSKQIEAVTGINTIGKIPPMEHNRLFSFNKHRSELSNFPFAEAFRRLNVQLFLQNNNQKNGGSFKVFMVTSSEPGEGKSTITSNLAIAMAQSGKKVIVVDCDLHIPQQHKLHDLSNQVGLSTVLQNPVSEITVKKTRYPGMFVLTSGTLPDSPTKLLGSSQMISVLTLLSKQYDAVLLDTPAYLTVSDAAQLVSMVDGVLMVVRRNYIREESVIETCKQLVEIKAPILGIVINDAERNSPYYYYGER